MRWLAILVAVAALAWSGWWWIGATALDRGLEAGVTAARAEGWRVDYADASIGGFPNRFDTTLTGIDVAAPDGSVAWQAPFLQVLALSYRPNHVIAVAPPTQTLRLPVGTFEIASGDLRASAVVSASTEPSLLRATIVSDDLQVNGPGFSGSLKDGQIAIREAAGDATYDLAVNLTDLALSGLATDLPDGIDTVNLDAEIGLDRPLQAGLTTPPVLQRLDLRRAEATWRDIRLTAVGALDIDHMGRPTGTLTVAAEGWETLLTLLTDAGIVLQDQAPLIRAGLEGMAVDGTVEFPLTLQDGQVRLGAIPLGPAPILAPVR